MVYHLELPDNDKGSQCELLTGKEGEPIDPSGFTEVFLWFSVVIGIFLYHIVDVSSRLNNLHRTTQVLIQRDSAAFPAVTVCNYNPFQRSLIEKMSNDYVGQSTDLATLRRDHGSIDNTQPRGRRPKRAKTTKYEPAYSVCKCETMDCTAEETLLPEEAGKFDEMCICAFDRDSGDAWPCYPKQMWTKEECASCEETRSCERGEEGKNSRGPSCLCESHDDFCLALLPQTQILKLWEYYGRFSEETQVLPGKGLPTKQTKFTTPSTYRQTTVASKFNSKEDFFKNYDKARQKEPDQSSDEDGEEEGETNLFLTPKDKAGLKTSATIAELSLAQRRSFSTQKHQLIQKCSFNRKPCNIERDFRSIDDYIYGNCFTFNHQWRLIKNVTRIGAKNGLRLLLFVNASQYLPTTERVGVRFTIHNKDEFPFPEVYGYSAPTGSKSSEKHRDSIRNKVIASTKMCRNIFTKDTLTPSRLKSGECDGRQYNRINTQNNAVILEIYYETLDYDVIQEVEVFQKTGLWFIDIIFCGLRCRTGASVLTCFEFIFFAGEVAFIVFRMAKLRLDIRHTVLERALALW